MTAFRGPLAAIVAALCLAIPASAVGQSAGDDQYADPFTEEQAPNKTLAQQDESDSPAPVTDSTGTNPASTSTSTSGASAGRLAYTGFNLPLLFVTGAVMLLAGLTVRRVAAGPYSPR